MKTQIRSQIGALAVMALVFSGPAMAAFPGSQLMQRALRASRHGKASPGLHVQAAQCTDFTGLWEGSCTLPDGTQHNDGQIIAQLDCDDILIGGDLFGFAGANTSSFLLFMDGQTLNVSSSATLDWNPDQSQINYIDQDVLRQVGRNGAVGTDNETGKLWIDTGKLHSEVVAAEGKTECVYTKQ